MQVESGWKKFFQNWPSGLSQTGVVVTSFAEQIPFGAFLVSSEMLVLQRKTPDTVGTRQVVLPFEKIDAVKITDIVDLNVFTQAGFESVVSS